MFYCAGDMPSSDDSRSQILSHNVSFTDLHMHMARLSKDCSCSLCAAGFRLLHELVVTCAAQCEGHAVTLFPKYQGHAAPHCAGHLSCMCLFLPHQELLDHP